MWRYGCIWIKSALTLTSLRHSSNYLYTSSLVIYDTSPRHRCRQSLALQDASPETRRSHLALMGWPTSNSPQQLCEYIDSVEKSTVCSEVICPSKGSPSYSSATPLCIGDHLLHLSAILPPSLKRGRLHTLICQESPPFVSISPSRMTPPYTPTPPHLWQSPLMCRQYLLIYQAPPHLSAPSNATPSP